MLVSWIDPNALVMLECSFCYVASVYITDSLANTSAIIRIHGLYQICVSVFGVIVFIVYCNACNITFYLEG